MKWLDVLAENTARTIARRTSRRSVIAGLGSLLLGAGTVPLLPVARGADTKPAGTAPGTGAPNADPGDPASCEYWRHCAVDGFLCGCCGGSHTECPAGTIMSPTSWVGTCRDPNDGKEYIIGYRDCCGKDVCGRCFCENNKGDMPIYRTQLDNGVIWCFGTKPSSYVVNCTTAVRLGLKT